MPSFLDSLRDYWEKLSDRERRMLSIMGGSLLVLVVFALVWTTSSAVAEVKEERDEMRAVLNDIDRAADLLQKRQAERQAIESRYQIKAPPLAAYVESKAKEQGLEVRQVAEDPEKSINGYRRQSVRAAMAGISLRPLLHLLVAIEQEPAPIAIERIVIEHYAPGDSYKVDVGVSAFDAPEKGKKAKPAAQGAP
jgi:general secretion pathway protein M